MLEQSRFLAMKNLAKDIRRENEQTFKSFENESVDDAIREKEEFVESIIDNMNIAFSEGDKGKEEKQIFRANLLIPDDVAFFEAYSKDKNIRNLMNKYSVGIEDIMSKITELNLYSKYIDTFNEPAEEKVVETPAEEPVEKEEFVDDMVNLSSKEAESLLDEIEDLSSAMEELEIKTNEEAEEEQNISLQPETIEESSEVEINDEIPSFEETEDEEDEGEADEISFDFENVSTELNPSSSDSYNLEIEDEENSEEEIEITGEIENISSAVSEFVDEYTKVKKELEFTQAKADKFNSEKEELRKHLTALKDEKETLERENEQIKEELDRTKEELRKHAAENKTLKEQVKVMEKTARQSTDLLKEIYKSIPKKRFNVK